MFKALYKVGDRLQHTRTKKIGKVVSILPKDMEPPHEVWSYYYSMDWDPIVNIAEGLLTDRLEPAVIESISQFQIGYGADSIHVRVWREEKELKGEYPETREELLEVIKQWEREYYVTEPAARVDLMKMLGRAERVNAVEVKDCQGTGTVIYMEWP